MTTRRLTKPWECAGRNLYYYEFAADRFCEQSSEVLLTSSESFGYDVERFLNKKVETHLTTYLDSLAAGAWTRAIPWRQERALVLSILFQGTRVAAANGDKGARSDLRQMLTKGNAYLDRFAKESYTRLYYFGGKVPDGQFLYFPSNGLSVLPIVGGSGVFQPTGPSTFIAAIPVATPVQVAEAQIDHALSSGTLAACSVGLKCDLTIVPPAIRAGSDEVAIRASIRGLRDAANKLVETIASVNKTAGF